MTCGPLKDALRQGAVAEVDGFSSFFRRGSRPANAWPMSKNVAAVNALRARPSHAVESSFRPRTSPAASASSQSRNAMIFGKADVAFGQTIQ
jgi:hypothetical protein